MAEERGDCNREIVDFETFALETWKAHSHIIESRNEHKEAQASCLFCHLGQKRQFDGADDPMPKSEEDLFAFLDELGIAVSTLRHPPLFTVADSQALRGEIPGGHTKNLFLKDKKDHYFLVTVDEEASVDLKQIHHLIGAAGRVSFGRPEKLMELLGVVPGAVTVFGLINDARLEVKVVLDEALMQNAVINAHPLTNEATTSIAAGDLLSFIKATGHDPVILKVAA